MGRLDRCDLSLFTCPIAFVYGTSNSEMQVFRVGAICVAEFSKPIETLDWGHGARDLWVVLS
jgi:hypothetical protein